MQKRKNALRKNALHKKSAPELNLGRIWKDYYFRPNRITFQERG